MDNELAMIFSFVRGYLTPKREKLLRDALQKASAWDKLYKQVSGISDWLKGRMDEFIPKEELSPLEELAEWLDEAGLNNKPFIPFANLRHKINVLLEKERQKDAHRTS